MLIIKIDEEKSMVYIYDVTADTRKLEELKDEININCGKIDHFLYYEKKYPVPIIDKTVITEEYNCHDEEPTKEKTYEWEGYKYHAELAEDIDQFIQIYKKGKVCTYNYIELLLALDGSKKYPSKEITEKKNNKNISDLLYCIHNSIQNNVINKGEMKKEDIIPSTLFYEIKMANGFLNANKIADEIRELKDQNDYIEKVAKLIEIKCTISMDYDTYNAAIEINENGHKLKPMKNKKQD